MSDALGDRMKMYEKRDVQKFMPLLPIVARLDGKGFSKFTKGFGRPYDERFSNLMQNLSRKLVEETNACIGYTQSDEISLVFYSGDKKSQIFFDGKIHKMVSDLASMASAWMQLMIPEFIPERVGVPAMFDCRVWQVPNHAEATNAILWREFDATKNSIQMAAHSVYSHKQLLNKHGGQMQDMLMEKGINWNDYPAFFKRGSYFQRRKELTKFSAVELERLPPKHSARTNPDLEIMRTRVKRLNMPPLNKVVNRIQVIFDGQEPMTEVQEG